tara:strand:+ start:1395 stop:1616 length:222 start_codon:yes stop_codon:yes gene_type:complete
MMNGSQKDFELLDPQSDHTFAEWLRNRKIDAVDDCHRVNNTNRWHGRDGRVMAIVAYHGACEHSIYVRKETKA